MKTKYILIILIACGLWGCKGTKNVVADKTNSNATIKTKNDQNEIQNVVTNSQLPPLSFIDSLKNGKIFYSLGTLDYTDELYTDIPEVFKIVFPNAQYVKHTALTIPTTSAIGAVYENEKFGLSGDFNTLYKKTHSNLAEAPFEKRILALIYVMEEIMNKKIEIISIQEGLKKIEPPLQYTEFNYEIVANVNNEINTYYLLFKDNKVYCLVKLRQNRFVRAMVPNIY